MGKVVKVEYDAATHALRLTEPVDGLADHQKFTATLDDRPAAGDEKRPWLEFSGILSEEAGEDFARAINEMFPPWTGDDD